MSKKILNYIFKKVSKKFKQGTYSSGGRNFSGRICVFHRGGGCVREYRLIDFHRRLNSFGTVCKIVYDPNRSAYLGFILYETGFFSFIILSEEKKVGDLIFSGIRHSSNFYYIGSSLEVSNVKAFSVVSCIESRPFFGATVARAAGVGALLLYFDKKIAVLKLVSGWYLHIPQNCVVTLGAVSNARHNARVLHKAGVNRLWGIRPTVRGVAMNPCDHPHGGGNGKTNTPAMAVSPWGRNGKGVHTNNKKKDKIFRRIFKYKS